MSQNRVITAGQRQAAVPQGWLKWADWGCGQGQVGVPVHGKVDPSNMGHWKSL